MPLIGYHRPDTLGGAGISEIDPGLNDWAKAVWEDTLLFNPISASMRETHVRELRELAFNQQYIDDLKRDIGDISLHEIGKMYPYYESVANWFPSGDARQKLHDIRNGKINWRDPNIMKHLRGYGGDDPYRIITKDEANKQFGKISGFVYTKDMPWIEASYKARVKYFQTMVQFQRGRDKTSLLSLRTPVAFGAGLIGSMLDPVNVGVALIPVVGEARLATLVAKHGRQMFKGAKSTFFTKKAREAGEEIFAAMTAGQRAKTRFIRGAIEGTVGAAAIEPLILDNAEQFQLDYDMYDTMMNLTFGAAIGGGLHVGLGGLRDFMDVKRQSRKSGVIRQVVETASDASDKQRFDFGHGELALRVDNLPMTVRKVVFDYAARLMRAGKDLTGIDKLIKILDPSFEDARMHAPITDVPEGKIIQRGDGVWEASFETTDGNLSDIRGEGATHSEAANNLALNYVKRRLEMAESDVPHMDPTGKVSRQAWVNNVNDVSKPGVKQKDGSVTFGDNYKAVQNADGTYRVEGEFETNSGRSITADEAIPENKFATPEEAQKAIFEQLKANEPVADAPKGDTSPEKLDEMLDQADNAPDNMGNKEHSAKADETYAESDKMDEDAFIEEEIKQLEEELFDELDDLDPDLDDKLVAEEQDLVNQGELKGQDRLFEGLEKVDDVADDAPATQVEPPTTTRATGTLREQFKSAFGLSDAQADRVAAVWDAFAQHWAKRTGRPAEEFIEAALSHIESTTDPDVRAKGASIFLDDGKAIIQAFESGDVSTAMHESLHIFRRWMDPEDLASLEAWLGIEDGDWTQRINGELPDEIVAANFEAWLTEGRIPEGASDRVRAVFEDFKGWMGAIYRKFAASGASVKIPDNVRNVFEKIIATPEEMAEMRYKQGVKTKTGADPTGKPLGKLSPDELEARMDDVEGKLDSYTDREVRDAAAEVEGSDPKIGELLDERIAILDELEARDQIRHSRGDSFVIDGEETSRADIEQMLDDASVSPGTKTKIFQELAAGRTPSVLREVQAGKVEIGGEMRFVTEEDITTLKKERTKLKRGRTKAKKETEKLEQQGNLDYYDNTGKAAESDIVGDQAKGYGYERVRELSEHIDEMDRKIAFMEEQKVKGDATQTKNNKNNGPDKLFQREKTTGDVWVLPDQEIGSAATSINKTRLPATFNRVTFTKGTRNADIGGGKFNNATDHLAQQGVENVIYDPFNRPRSENVKAIKKISDGKADTATVNNVLNVIKEPGARDLTIRQAADAIKPEGKAYFLIFEGDKSGTGKATSKGFQGNKAASAYEAEIGKHFGEVKRKGNLIEASEPKKAPKNPSKLYQGKDAGDKTPRKERGKRAYDVDIEKADKLKGIMRQFANVRGTLNSLEEGINELRKLAKGILNEREIKDAAKTIEGQAELLLREKAVDNLEDAYRVASDDYVKAVKRTAMIKKRKSLDNLRKYMKIIKYIKTNFADDPVRGLKAVLTGDPGFTVSRGRKSIATDQEALIDKYHSGMHYDLHKAGLADAWTSGDFDRGVFRVIYKLSQEGRAKGKRLLREMSTADILKEFGEELGESAVNIAKIIDKWKETMRRDANLEGADIGDLSDHLIAQTHDLTKLTSIFLEPKRFKKAVELKRKLLGARMTSIDTKANYAKWREFVKPRVDWLRTCPGCRTEAEIEDFMKSTFKALVTGIHESGGPAIVNGNTGTRDIAGGLSKSRVLHFADGDAAMDYQVEFGRGNLREAVLKNFESTANQVALMRSFGANPDAMFKRVRMDLAKEYGKDNFFEHKALANSTALQDGKSFRGKMLEAHYKEVSGYTNIADSDHMARVGSMIRAIESMARLGGSAITAISDVAIVMSELQGQGMTLLESADAVFSTFVKGIGDQKQLQEIGMMMDIFSDGLRGQIGFRHAAHDVQTGGVSKVMQRYFKWNGLQWWTDTMRLGSTMAFSGRLATLADSGITSTGKAWDGLDDTMRNMMDLFGIGEREFNLMAKKAIVEGPDGRKYFSPRALEELADADIAEYLDDLRADDGLPPKSHKRAVREDGKAKLDTRPREKVRGKIQRLEEQRDRRKVERQNFKKQQELAFAEEEKNLRRKQKAELDTLKARVKEEKSKLPRGKKADKGREGKRLEAAMKEKHKAQLERIKTDDARAEARVKQREALERFDADNKEKNTALTKELNAERAKLKQLDRNPPELTEDVPGYTPDQIQRGRNDLTSLLRSYYVDSVNAAVVKPTADVNAVTRLGYQRGTVMGEFLRFAFQFKSFPIAVYRGPLKRAMNRNGGKVDWASMATLMVGGTVLGYTSMAIKDLLKGKEPRDPTQLKTIMASFLQGGAAGIYVDMVLGATERTGFGKPSYMAGLLGPFMGGTLENMAQITGRLARGEKVAAQAWKFALSHTPYMNVFWFKPVFDYMIGNSVAETLSPGYLRRLEKFTERDTGQKFFAPPRTWRLSESF